MHRDFKIGLVVGLVIATIAAVWLCTLPKLGTEARVLRKSVSGDANPQQPAPESEPSSDLHPAAGENESAGAPNEPQAPSGTSVQPRVHIVQKGETLAWIAEKYYGSSRQWSKIAAANRDVISDPNKLVPGSRLIIP